MHLPRLYPILDTQRPLPLQEQCAACLAGGSSFFQVRHKGVWTDEMLCVLEAAIEQGARLIVNDRADIAATLRAGVHVGQTDLAPREARRLAGDQIVGFSTHNAEQLVAAAAEPVDYVALGPIFATGSKANPDPVVGLANLKLWRALCGRPLVAIGGITRENAPDVLTAGADAVAVIADLYPDGLTAGSLEARIKEWNRLLN